MIPLSRLASDGHPASRIVALTPDTALTAGQWRRDVGVLAQRLKDAHVRRAVLSSENSYAFTVGLFALLHAGAVVRLPPNTLPGTLKDTAEDGDLILGDTELAELGAGDAPVAPLPPLMPENCRLEFFTSGSTGAAKLIAKTLDQLERELATVEGMWGSMLGDAAFYGTVSHQHIYGLTFRVLWPLSAGRAFTAEADYIWEGLLERAREPYAVISSPAHLSRLGGLPGIDQRAALILSAGAPLNEDAARDASALFGAPVTEIFGSTETGAMAFRRHETEEVPAWRAVDGVTIDTADDGTMRIRSPFLGTSDWYGTADRIAFDAGGGFRVLGRADGVVKIEGKRVGLREVEERLLLSPHVEAAAVFIPTPVEPETRNSRRLCAVVVLTEVGRQLLDTQGPLAMQQQLRRELGTHLEPSALPRRWRFVAAMPTDGMGKRRKADLERLFVASSASPAMVDADE